MRPYQWELLLIEEGPAGEPAKHEIDGSMNNLVGSGRKLESKMKTRLRGEEVDQDRPQKRRELVFDKVLQTPSTPLMAAGR